MQDGQKPQPPRLARNKPGWCALSVEVLARVRRKSPPPHAVRHPQRTHPACSRGVPALTSWEHNSGTETEWNVKNPPLADTRFNTVLRWTCSRTCTPVQRVHLSHHALARRQCARGACASAVSANQLPSVHNNGFCFAASTAMGAGMRGHTMAERQRRSNAYNIHQHRVSQTGTANTNISTERANMAATAAGPARCPRLATWKPDVIVQPDAGQGWRMRAKRRTQSNRNDHEDSRGKDMGSRRRELWPRRRRTNRPDQNPATQTQKTRDFATPYVQVSSKRDVQTCRGREHVQGTHQIVSQSRVSISCRSSLATCQGRVRAQPRQELKARPASCAPSTPALAWTATPRVRRTPQRQITSMTSRSHPRQARTLLGTNVPKIPVACVSLRFPAGGCWRQTPTTLQLGQPGHSRCGLRKCPTTGYQTGSGSQPMGAAPP